VGVLSEPLRGNTAVVREEIVALNNDFRFLIREALQVI
jgi:hypothetical protein